MKRILVTGVAGFIGMHVARYLLARGNSVIGLDNMNDYYDVALKKDRLSQLTRFKNFIFYKCDISSEGDLERIFNNEKPTGVIHLAAQAGVRYSLKNPQSYIKSNLVGFGNILELSWKSRIEHLVYASSSSVYGGNAKVPFEEGDPVDNPVSLYAATKKSNELMAHAYSHLYGLPTTGLRFFTVYGPWGRPDMSPMLFSKAILDEKPIQIFNDGDMSRDFTYIDDVVEGVVKAFDRFPSGSKGESDSKIFKAGSSDVLTPYKIFNIGNCSPINLIDYINNLEKAWGKKAQKEYCPMQAGDVKKTMAETKRLENWVGFRPETSLEEGLQNLVTWYKDYYQVN